MKNDSVNPVAESLELRKSLTELEMKIAQSNIQALEYLNFKKKIERGELSVMDFQQVVPTNSYGILRLEDSDSGFLKESLALENELAAARLTYLPNSKRITNLENKLKLLKPEIQKKQLETIDTSISLNKTKLAVLNEQKEILNKKILKQADLIEPFNFIIKKLEAVRFAQLDLKTTKEKYLLDKKTNKKYLEDFAGSNS